jgi:hypothetical protein
MQELFYSMPKGCGENVGAGQQIVQHQIGRSFSVGLNAAGKAGRHENDFGSSFGEKILDLIHGSQIGLMGRHAEEKTMARISKTMEQCPARQGRAAGHIDACSRS